MKRLAIISHTEHYRLPDGSIVGFGPTITEINHLLDIFDRIHHIAMIHEEVAPAHALPYASDRITFVPIPALGGQDLAAKVHIMVHAFSILKTIATTLRKNDYFQFRGPTGIGVFVIPYLVLCSHKKGWFKYAGNWKQEHAPLAYKFQRWLLKHQSRKVTINGVWEGQPQQCLSFENPCLTGAEITIGNIVRATKNLRVPLQLCFVGRLEAAKGVDCIIDAIANLDTATISKIGLLRMIGTSERLSYYHEKCQKLGLPIEFLGILSRSEVHDIYKNSHAILLPSLSEGFPKVIAEAMNYGCVPIVSDVSSLSQYVKHAKNGFLLRGIDTDGLTEALNTFLNLSENDFKHLIQWHQHDIDRFSYTFYNHRIQNEIILSS